MQQTFDPFTLALTAQIPLTLMIGAIIGWPLSLWLLNRYHKAVSRTMGKNSSRGEASVPDIAEQKNKPGVPDTSITADALYNKLIGRPGYLATVHLAAGIVFAFVMTAVTLISSQQEFYPRRMIFLMYCYLWPVIFTINIIASLPVRTRRLLFTTYLMLFVAIGMYSLANSPELTWSQLIFYWCLNNIPPTLLLLIFLQRSVRAVGPLVLSFLGVAVLGVILVPTLFSANTNLLRSVAEPAFRIGLGATGVLIVLQLAGLMAFGIIGWIALRILRNLYNRKKISDQSITLDSIWIIFGISYAVWFAFEGYQWVLAGVLAVIGYKLIVTAGYRLINRWQRNTVSSNLLFLRVFSLGKRSAAFFNMISHYWRLSGSIQLISGPDLATTTIEPHEFMDYLSGRLSRRFISSNAELHTRLNEMDNKPDRDGRYRVNDFFCYNNTWKMVLEHLVQYSNVVLMDLRSFGVANKGCEYEIRQLLNIVPLHKIIFVTDSTTDYPFLKQTLQVSLQSMRADSPNITVTVQEISVFEFNKLHHREWKALLRKLAIAATTETRIAATETGNRIRL